MKVIKFFIAAMLCFLFFIPQQVFSQVKREEKVYRLDKVIVRDHPLRDESMVVTPDVTVINVDKFQKAGPVETIRDVLSEALGLTVLKSSVTPSQSEGIYIRGMDQSRYQVFMDGRPMRLHGSHGYFKMDWTTVPLDNVETIEIVRGSHSLLYPFSMGGAINIITKKGKKTDDLKPDCIVKTGFGPYGAQSYSANATGGIFETIGYSLATAHREGDGYLRGNDYDTNNFNGRFTLYLPTGGTITYGIDYVDTVTGYALINDPDDTASNYDSSYPIVRAGEVDTFTHDKEGKAYAGGRNYWEKDVTSQSLLVEQPLPVGELRGQVYKEGSNRDTYAHYANGSDTHSYKHEYTGGVALDYLNFDLIDNHSLSIGGDYRNQGTYANKNFYEIWAVFVQDVWSIADSITLTFGTRWYEFTSDSYKFGDASMKTERVETEWCPKARLNYDFDDTLSLYAAVSREMRTP